MYFTFWKTQQLDNEKEKVMSSKREDMQILTCKRPKAVAEFMAYT